MNCSKRLSALAIVLSFATSYLYASSEPIRGRNGMVASQKMLASEAGLGVLRDGGSAVDAAVATGLALAVTLPRAGNNTVVQTILHTVDYGLNAQEATAAGRFHHQWLPDRIRIEENAFSPDTLALLRAKGHAFQLTTALGCAQVIVYNREEEIFEGGSDLRRRDGGVAAY